MVMRRVEDEEIARPNGNGHTNLREAKVLGNIHLQLAAFPLCTGGKS
jgi:hypothetical protein